MESFGLKETQKENIYNISDLVIDHSFNPYTIRGSRFTAMSDNVLLSLYKCLHWIFTLLLRQPNILY